MISTEESRCQTFQTATEKSTCDSLLRLESVSVGFMYARSFVFSLFWMWSSLGGGFLCDREGVAGEPSSWCKLKLACRSWPDRVGMNLCRCPSASNCVAIALHLRHISPVAIYPWSFPLWAFTWCRLPLPRPSLERTKRFTQRIWVDRLCAFLVRTVGTLSRLPHTLRRI